MNFFDQQQDARRATRLLAWLFILALVILVLLVNFGVFSLWWLVALRVESLQEGFNAFVYYLSSSTCLVVSVVTLAVFASGSIRRSAQLRHNSTALASLVNATEVTYSMAASDEKQLINVVEEMAVAAGTPPPRLFVMRNETAINAFVTGIAPQQLLVVTQGALDALSRDELQGMIGHEFSHLLNGDTRLNLRMLILLAGLLSVGRLGLYLIALGRPERQLQSRIDFQRRIGGDVYDNNSNGLFILVGVVLVVAGYVGLFIGRMIKAAITRQREALADASAQQFTRNPAGLAGALIKIKNGPGSLLNHALAEDINHMCFGDGVRIHLRQLLATHPDIDTRLKEIDPSWIARARARERQQDNASATIGNPPDTRQLGYAQSLITSLPPALSQALHDANGACLVIYALLMDVSQQKFLPAVKPEDKQKLPALVEQITQLGSRTRLPLLDLALPALQRLEKNQLKQLLDNIDWLIKADGQVSLFEYLLRQLVRQRLLPTKASTVLYTRLDQLAGSVQLLLSMLIHHASHAAAAQQELFQRFASPLLPAGRQLLPLEKCSLKTLTQAMQQLRQLSPLLQKPLLDTCADIILVDAKVQVGEMELLRLVCLLLDCAMPPLITRETTS